MVRLGLAAALVAAVICVGAESALAQASVLGVFDKAAPSGKFSGFALPDGIAVDNAGTIWVADRDDNRVVKLSRDGTPQPFPAFRRRHRSAEPGRFNLPYGVATDPLGNVYVADTHNNRIQEFTPQGKLIRMFGTTGTGPGQLNDPRDVALDPFGNVWVADHENKRVVKFTADGRFIAMFGRNGGDGSFGFGPGEFNSPRGVESDAQGNIYVADDDNQRIQKLANDGSFITMWGGTKGPGDNQFNRPYGAAIDLAGHVWVADTGNNRVSEFTSDGVFISKIGANGGDGSEGNGPGQFAEPYNITTDCVGNVYVTDEENHRVQKLGDPNAPAPVCPPRITRLSVSGSAKAATVSVACDRPCRLAATGAISGGGRLRRAARVLTSAGQATLSLRAPHGAAGKRADVTVTATGAPGATRKAVRRVRLSR